MSKLKKTFNYISHVRKKSIEINKSGLYICYALISVYALIMSIVCFFKADITMGIVNIVIALFMILTILLFAKIKSQKILSLFVLIFLYTLMMFFMYEGGVGGVSIMWLLFVPMGGMALINLYYGGILSLILGISIPLYMLTPLHHLGYQYTEEYRIRFPIIYWAFVIMALVIFIRIDRFEEFQKDLIKKSDIANRSKSEFLANMSHEIRTPMNAIMGMCELTMNENISDIVRENSETIYRSSKNLMNIINDLLDFSKIESERMELSCSQYKLSDLLNDVIYMTIARMGNKELDFVVDCDSNIPNLLYGDNVRIKQVVINLLTNALKYTQKGGFVLTVRFREESYGINLIISVKDSGIGIKKEHINKIFDAYRRVDNQKNHAIEGTGLGLPITKKLVKLMDGTIQVKSEYDKGTEFKIVLPQKVMDPAPIVAPFDREQTQILYYNSEPNTENIYKELADKLSISTYFGKDMDHVKREINSGTYTHVIVGKKEYQENKIYFDNLSKLYSLAVIQDRNLPVSVDNQIQSLYKPLYSVNLVNFITRKSQHEDTIKITDPFVTPQAHVLVVDDNLINLKVAEGHLKTYQMQVDTATSGFEAIEKIKNQEYDIVFMDHLMPNMDGIETHQEIRLIKKDYIEKIPVIALTANASSEIKDLFIREGFQDFMSKPIQPNVLREVLLKWLHEDLIVIKKEGAE